MDFYGRVGGMVPSWREIMEAAEKTLKEVRGLMAVVFSKTKCSRMLRCTTAPAALTV